MLKIMFVTYDTCGYLNCSYLVPFSFDVNGSKTCYLLILFNHSINHVDSLHQNIENRAVVPGNTGFLAGYIGKIFFL
jgi:hypothetical protein